MKPIIELQNSVVHGMVVKGVICYTAPVVFGIPPGPGRDGSLTQNASCSAFQIGQNRFFITNDHVFRAFEALRQNDDRARFQVGDARPFDPIVLDRDARLDLITIDASSVRFEDIAERGEMIAFWPIRPSHWPLDSVKKGDFIAFGGWPQIYRQEEDGARVLVSSSWSLSAAAVSEVTVDGFTCVLDRSEWRDYFANIASGPEERNLGGLSGCPAFIVRELSFEFVGVLFEYLPGWDVLRFRHASLINDDGSLKRP